MFTFSSVRGGLGMTCLLLKRGCFFLCVFNWDTNSYYLVHFIFISNSHIVSASVVYKTHKILIHK